MKSRINLFLVLALLFCSCADILEDQKVRVKVHLDWTNLPKPPNGATVAFYPRSGTLTKPAFLLTNYTTDSLYLPAGVYDILVINETTDGHNYIRFTGTDKYETFEAYWDVSKLKATYSRANMNEAVINTDDMLAIERMEGFEITNEMQDQNSSLSLSFTPKLINIKMEVAVQLKGLFNISQSGSLLYMSGMASGYNLSRGEPSGNAVTHLTPLNDKRYNEGCTMHGSICATFFTFGLSKDISRTSTDNILRLVFKLRDGSTLPDIVMDATPMIVLDEDGSFSSDIVKDEKGDEIVMPDVPDTEIPDGDPGFDAEIGDWEDEDVIDVPI